MEIRTRYLQLFSIALVILIFATQGNAWFDKTHLAVGRVSGYEQWFNCASADVAKIKARNIENYNHFYNNPQNIEVSSEMLLDQASRYNNPNDAVGHLYGAIVGALREYRKATEQGKYAEYHLAYLCHYVADLSQPLHNVENDDFNRQNHKAFDGAVDDKVSESLERIRKHMYAVALRRDHFEDDLAREVARIANVSRALALSVKKDTRMMTDEEAFVQLGRSASLLKAILQVLKGGKDGN